MALVPSRTKIDEVALLGGVLRRAIVIFCLIYNKFVLFFIFSQTFWQTSRVSTVVAKTRKKLI